MQAVLGTIVIAIAISFAGPAGAAAPATPAPVNASAVKGTVVAQRCRCVERRWNGSCKKRVCKNRW